MKEKNQTLINLLESISKPDIKKEINDMFEIYLESDIAGDNQDRKNKLNAIKIVNKVFST